MSARRGWPEALVKILSPDRAEAWYIAAYDPLTQILWGAFVSASGFRIDTVACSTLAGWRVIEIEPVHLAHLAVGWLTRRWSATGPALWITDCSS